MRLDAPDEHNTSQTHIFDKNQIISTKSKILVKI